MTPPPHLPASACTRAREPPPPPLSPVVIQHCNESASMQARRRRGGGVGGGGAESQWVRAALGPRRGQQGVRRGVRSGVGGWGVCAWEKESAGAGSSGGRSHNSVGRLGGHWGGTAWQALAREGGGGGVRACRCTWGGGGGAASRGASGEEKVLDIPLPKPACVFGGQGGRSVRPRGAGTHASALASRQARPRERGAPPLTLCRSPGTCGDASPGCA